MSWSSLCWPQKEGGLGFRNLWDFNQALLSKLGWKILTRKDCLYVNVLRARYKIHNNWLTHSYSSHASLFWKSLLGIKHLISKATCILFGNGDSIRIWSDPWIPNLPGFIPSPKVDANPNLALVVSQLLSSNHNRWDIPKLNYFFKEPVVDLILKIPIPIYQTEDSWS